jgi:hypothetical protein
MRSPSCAVPKLAHGGWTAALCSLGCSPVLADQAVDDLPALDPGGHIDGAARLMQRRILVQRLVRPVAVIVPCELGQHRPQMLLAKDQHVIEALPAECAHEPLRK